MPMNKIIVTNLVYGLMGEQDKYHNISQDRTIRAKMEV